MATKTRIRPEVLAFIRRASKNAVDADSSDLRLLMSANIMPKSILEDHFDIRGGRDNPDNDKWYEHMDRLVELGRIEESNLYYRANPRDRIRPIATEYNVERPYVPWLRAKYKTTITINGRDRLALWYAVANKDLSGSLGESWATYEVLKFWRLPRIQRAWRKYTRHYNLKLPKEIA